MAVDINVIATIRSEAKVDSTGVAYNLDISSSEGIGNVT